MIRYLSLIILLNIFIAGCNNLKKLPAGEKLYTGAKVTITDNPKSKKSLASEAATLTRPKPNKKFLGMRIKLSLYNLAKPPKKKGLNYLLREKWGEPPVLFSSVKTAYNADVLNNYFWNKGFFKAIVDPAVKTTTKTASVEYKIIAGHRYAINTVNFPKDSSSVGKAISRTQAASLLKVGDNFNLDVIKAERERIDQVLKNRGYYYFNPNNLLVQVDSTLDGKVDLFVKVKDNAAEASLETYKIRDIVIYSNYALETDTSLKQQQAQVLPKYTVIDSAHVFKPRLFDNIIVLSKDSLYRRYKHNATLQRLVGLNTFKFVKVDFEPVGDTAARLLDATFYLTPQFKRSLQFELSGNSKSNNFVGSEVKVQLKNRNFLKRAEELTISLAGGFEQQVGGTKTQLSSNAYTLTGEANLLVPRFIIPFHIVNLTSPFVPRTRFNLAYELLNRTNLYTLRGFRGSMGYVWKQNRKIQHDFAPFSFNSVNPTNITDSFQNILNQDLSLRQSFEKQFIVGSSYTLTFNNQARQQRTNYTNANFNVDVSGNFLGLITKTNATVNGDKKTLFGQQFAQFVKLTLDLTHYRNINQNVVWANRLVTGYGYAYGNSLSLPFVKQYFIGGSNSIRAFRARTLGPGSYYSNNSQFIASEAGDIKLEMNTELRAKLFGIVNGALFVDAGNIWLRNDAPGKPGSKFELKNVWKELAVGTGAGIRIDASILVVRFDLAFPLRKPWLPEAERWVFDKIKFGNSQWRKENLILNIAIGYPF
jgi:outer membrane protein assembly factor BamA